MATATTTSSPAHPARDDPEPTTPHSSAAEWQLRWRDVDDEFHISSISAAKRVAFDRFAPVHRVSAYVEQGHFSGRFALSSSGRHVIFRSRIGLDCLFLLDFERDVEDVVGLPFYVRSVDSERVGFVPDYLVKLAGGQRRMVSVAWAGRDGGEKAREAHAALDAACTHLGWRHVVMGPPHPTLLLNLTWLHGARREPAWFAQFASGVLEACQSWTPFGDVCATHESQALVRAVMLHLLWTHAVVIHDLSAPITDDTLVRAR